MNIGISRGDKREHVLENYKRLASAMGFDETKLGITAQVHGDVVRVVQNGSRLYDPVPFPCDAVITNQPNIALFVYTADCVPILLYEPEVRCIGAVHAGWKGTANGLLGKTVQMLCTEYHARTENLLAAIGPSIGQCCFEVDQPVYQQLKETYPELDAYTERRAGKYNIDLKALNRLMLERCGVPAKNISVSYACTKCDAELFWSHRRDGNERGLQGAMIVLTENCAEPANDPN